MKTAGRWPWKSESAKECVTTHLPNALALKIDGAAACYRYLTIVANMRQQCVRGRKGSVEAYCVSFGGTALSVDLGGSSKYSNENFEDRSGEGFHENSNWSWVTRS